MASFPSDLRYTKDHEWARTKGDTIVIGITSFAVEQLGDVTLVDLPDHGQSPWSDHFDYLAAADQVAALLGAGSGGKDDPVALVGHSMGGKISMLVARTFSASSRPTSPAACSKEIFSSCPLVALVAGVKMGCASLEDSWSPGPSAIPQMAPVA